MARPFCDAEPLDRYGVRGKAHRRYRQGKVTGPVEADRQFRAFKARIGDLQFAAQQRAQCEFQAKRFPADPSRLARAAKLDVVQDEGRRRQQTGIDGAGNLELEPGQSARARLEVVAVTVPIDEERPYQRRHQRQNDHNRKSEQRRLHAVSTTGVPKVLAPDGARLRENLSTDRSSTIRATGLRKAKRPPLYSPIAPVRCIARPDLRATLSRCSGLTANLCRSKV